MPKLSSYRIRLLALAALLLLPGAALGMTVIAADLPDLVRDSQTIIRGFVVDVQNVVLDTKGRVLTEEVRLRTRDHAPIGLRAFTDVRVRVDDRYKGDAPVGGTLTLRLVGGRMGGYTLAVPGMPGFTPNQDVLLFLEETGQGLTPLGAAQGVFRIERGPSGALEAVHDIKGMSVLRQDHLPDGCVKGTVADTAECVPTSAPGLPAIPDRMPLEVLDGQIRAALGLPASTHPLLVPAAPLRRK